MYVLGIDGGGTKTTGVIANLKGEVIAQATVGPSNPNSVNKTDVRKELTALIKELDKKSNNLFPEVKRVFAGMSGVDHPLARKEMQHVISSIMPVDVKVSIDNDGITALYSGTLGKPGIVQIAGTGSITLGLNNQGERGRVGGWGYLIGEKGSGFALGRDGLQAAFLAHDKVKEATELNQLMLNHFQVKSLPDVIPLVYQAKNVKELMASLSKLVMEAADNRDSVAIKIIKKNGLQMGVSIACLIEKLYTRREQTKSIPIVLTGGLFNRLDLFKANIEEEIVNNNHINAKIVIPQMLPVGGAIIAALQEEHVEIHKDFPIIFRDSENAIQDSVN